MIQPLDFTDLQIVERALLIQKLAYCIEADLIGFDGIPALHEGIDDLRASDESFVGYVVEGLLAGVVSFAIEDHTLEIGRLVVHPDFFRRGIAKALIKYVEAIESDIRCIIVSTGKKNAPARTFYEKLHYNHTGDVTLAEGVTISQYEKVL